MPFKAFKRIYDSTKPKKLPEKELQIRDARGNDLGYKGTYLVSMQILGRKVMHDLVILDHVQDHIFGTNFIERLCLSYNSLSDKCFWETPPIDSGQLKAAERTFVDALSSKKIKLKCMDDNNKSIGISNEMIATIDTPTQSHHRTTRHDKI